MFAPNFGVLTYRASYDAKCFGQDVWPIWGTSFYVKHRDAWMWSGGINVLAGADWATTPALGDDARRLVDGCRGATGFAQGQQAIGPRGLCCISERRRSRIEPDFPRGEICENSAALPLESAARGGSWFEASASIG